MGGSKYTSVTFPRHFEENGSIITRRSAGNTARIRSQNKYERKTIDMTCIVGLQRNGTVWIGGDSAGTAGNMHQRVRADKKVFIKGEFIIGFSGSFRMGQLLRHSLVPPEHVQGQDDLNYLVNDFVIAVRTCLEKEPEDAAPRFLFGYRGKLYGMQGDYQVAQPEDDFDALGSGGDVAIGALYASKSTRETEKRLTQALEASARNNAAVRPPFTIMKLKNGEVA